MAKANILHRSRKAKALDLFRSDKLEEARTRLLALCRTSEGSRDSELWCLLGVIYGQKEDYENSYACCQKAVQLAPAYAEALYNLGQACMHLGKIEEAAAAYRSTIALQSDYPHACENLAYTYQRRCQYDEAIKYYNKAIELNPGDAGLLTSLGHTYESAGRTSSAVDCFRKALGVDPGHIKAYIRLGYAFAILGRLDDALWAFNKAREIDPESDESCYGIATVLEKRGDFDAAFRLLEPFIDRGRADEQLAMVFSLVARHVNQSRQAILLCERVLSNPDRQPEDARPLHYALGRLYDELKEYDKAFAHFEAANALTRLPVSPDRHVDKMAKIMAVCSADFMRNTANATNSTEMPIFIVGMPRSGTTLTEQILASHPAVYAGGERQDIGEITASIAMKYGLNSDYPEALKLLDARMLDNMAREYLDKVANEAGDAIRITDKMPHNFMHLGLISMMFPRARIIHCKRNPLDTCLSIYTYNFTTTHAYATNLRELGRHYSMYQSVMHHWKQVLTVPVLDLQYEETVIDTERVTREMLQFCGLPWDDACLKYYENRRMVNTISYDQVRRPIYTTSLERWRNYSPYLRQLKEELDLVDGRFDL